MEKEKRKFVIEYLADEIIQQVNGMCRGDQRCSTSDLHLSVDTFVRFIHKEQEYRLKP